MAFIELTKSRVELLFCQVLIIVDVVVLEQVEQCALKPILRQTFLLDNLKRGGSDANLHKQGNS